MTRAANLAEAAGSGFAFRNRIINGDMRIDQRNAGASVSAGGYTVDRFNYIASQSSKGTWGQNLNSVSPPSGFTKYLGFQSSSAYSVGSGDYFILYQPIEGYNIVDLSWGTSNAKTVTLSFQVYSSLTGTFGGALNNGSVSYPFTYAISSANTWTSIAITIPGPTSGTWGSTNGVGIQVIFGLGVGSSNAPTAGSWNYSLNALSATGAVSVVGTSGATWYVTGVQLEKGSVATPFEFRPYGAELALAQRYYYVVAKGVTQAFCMASWQTSTYLEGIVTFPVPMRATPTLTCATGASYYTLYLGNVPIGISTFSAEWATVNGSSLYNNSTVSGGTAGLAGWIGANNANAFIAFGAEL